jgi:hypothetical protein
MEPRESRLAKNEAVFREVNERVVEIKEELGPDPGAADLVDGLICESDENAGYWIVEKLEGVLADVARERDPRN